MYIFCYYHNYYELWKIIKDNISIIFMNLLKLIFIFISLFNYSNGKNKYSEFQEENSGDDNMRMNDKMIMSDKMIMKMDMNENELRTVLFQNYSKFNIPVINVDDSVLLKYGIQIESLE